MQPRRPSAISSTAYGLIVACDDGTVWELQYATKERKPDELLWVQVGPPIPGSQLAMQQEHGLHG